MGRTLYRHDRSGRSHDSLRQRSKTILLQYIPPTTFTTDPVFLAMQKNRTTFANPPCLFSRYSRHQSVGFYVLCDYSTGGHQTPGAKFDATYYCGVCADGCPMPDKGDLSIFRIVPASSGTRCQDVRKSGSRPNKDSIFNGDARKQGHVILDMTPVAHTDSLTNEHAMPQHAVSSNPDLWHEMTKMPDLAAFTNGTMCINDRGRMYENIIHF